MTEQTEPTIQELRSARARVQSEINHRRRLGKTTAHLEYDLKHLGDMLAERGA